MFDPSPYPVPAAVRGLLRYARGLVAEAVTYAAATLVLFCTVPTMPVPAPITAVVKAGWTVEVAPERIVYRTAATRL